jgi:thiamine-phosphate pyrophosphorylase
MLRYAITNDPSPETLLPQMRRWATSGMDYVQLREKRLPIGELRDLAASMLDIIRETGAATRLLINSRADVALAAGAHGVHLTSQPGELAPQQIHQLFAKTPSSIVSVPTLSISCHSVEEVTRAYTLGADLILFGPVFEKRVARQLITDGSGLEMLRRACLAAKDTPVLALGGITEENTGDCLEAGAAGIAAIRLFS